MKMIILVLVSVMLASVVYADGQINIAYTPYTISTPGSYIVVKNLTTAQNLNAITINTSDVFIDLNGHTLYGAGSTTGSSGDGINAGSSSNNIFIANGVVRDFKGNGITLSGNNVQIMKVKVIGNGLQGIYVWMSNNGLLADNIAQGNNDGIYALENFIIRDNNAYANVGVGIETGNDCTLTGNSMQNNVDGIDVWSNCYLKDNTVLNNTGTGISVEGSNCLVVGNTITGQNSTFGLAIKCLGVGNRIDSNHITNNHYGIEFQFATNWYGRNTFNNNSGGNVIGSSVPADPGSPYNNQSF